MKDLTLGLGKIAIERGFTPLKTIIEAYASNGHTEFSYRKKDLRNPILYKK